MITLVRTCFACPEQYDALDGDGNNVGYLRLRHGHFTVQAHPPWWDGVGYGPLVYEAQPEGDGIFTDDERDRYLDDAKEAIARYLNIRPGSYGGDHQPKERRRYIEAAAKPRYKARDILEIRETADGTELERRAVVSFPPGTAVYTVPEVIDALRRAYEAGREDERGERL